VEIQWADTVIKRGIPQGKNTR